MTLLYLKSLLLKSFFYKSVGTESAVLTGAQYFSLALPAFHTPVEARTAHACLGDTVALGSVSDKKEEQK